MYLTYCVHLFGIKKKGLTTRMHYVESLQKCISDNNEIFNKNYGSLQYLIWLLKIPTDKPKNFFEIYRQFGKEPTQRSGQPWSGGLRRLQYSHRLLRLNTSWTGDADLRLCVTTVGDG